MGLLGFPLGACTDRDGEEETTRRAHSPFNQSSGVCLALQLDNLAVEDRARDAEIRAQLAEFGAQLRDFAAHKSAGLFSDQTCRFSGPPLATPAEDGVGDPSSEFVDG